MLTLTNKLKKYNLTMHELVVMFGYKDEITFRNSSAYKKRVKSIEDLIQHIENQLIERLKE